MFYERLTSIAVLQESLRLYPPVPLIARIANEDVDVGKEMV